MTIIIISLACVFSFFVAWGIGANDVANAIGTSVGSKALKIVPAVILAAIFEAGGAILAGSKVTYTIRTQIIDPHTFIQDPQLLILGMLAAMLAT